MGRWLAFVPDFTFMTGFVVVYEMMKDGSMYATDVSGYLAL